MRSLFTRILREPLGLFLILGGALFLADRWWGSRGAEVVEIDPAAIERLATLWQAQAGRLPSEDEMAFLVDDWVREEVLYREAKSLGLDRDDVIVRRRLAQKMSFLIEDGLGDLTPSDEEIVALWQANQARYVEPARYTFAHIYLSADNHPDLEADALALLAELGDSGDGGAWRQLGDPFMLAREYAERNQQEVAELFGGSFAAALDDLPVGSWSGPVESAYGGHLVRLHKRSPERRLPLEEARARVVADWTEREASRAEGEAYARIRSRYRVLLPDGTPVGESPSELEEAEPTAPAREP